MKWLALLYARLRALFTARALDQDMEREMRLHLDLLKEAFERSGSSDQDARLEAKRRFGNLTRLKELGTDIRGAGLLQTIVQDLRYAGRGLWKNPGFTIVAVLSLALGIGANTAIFSLMNHVLLRPLPVYEPESLVSLAAPGPKPGSTSCNDTGDCSMVFSYRMFRDLEREQSVFTGIGGHVSLKTNLAYEGKTLSGQGTLVSGSYFPILGLQPALGRLIGPGDDQTIGEARVVVLTHAYWRTRFDESPEVLNESLLVNGQPMTIIGVAPEGFDGITVGMRPQVFVPITLRRVVEPQFNAFDRRRNYWVYLFARLKPGVTIEEARAAINVPYHTIINEVEAPLQSGISDQTAVVFKNKQITLSDGQRGQSQLHQDASAPLTFLFGVALFVLLIACANVANLFLTRAAARSSEIAVRLSIGASRVRVFMQMLTESCLIAVLGGVAALVVAGWTLQLFAALLPVEVAVALDFQLDRQVLLFAATLSLGTGIICGLFPALHHTRQDLVLSLKGQDGRGTRWAQRFRSSLVAVQIGLSMALLIAAGLFTKSLFQVSHVDLGWRTENVVTFGISPGLNGYESSEAKALVEGVEDQLAALPGVTAVTSSTVQMLARNFWNSNVSVEGFQGDADLTGDNYNASYDVIGPGHFGALGMRLLAGREFTRADDMNRPKVAIVNEQFTRKFNLGSNPVGKRMKAGSGGELDTEIVGFVKNAKYNDVRGEIPPLFFVPYRQFENFAATTFYVRTALDANQVLPMIRPVISQLDANLPVENLYTMRQRVRDNLAVDRITSFLSAGFAILATLLAGIGLYGVMSFTVTQRTREIGLRIALGATPMAVRTMVFRQIVRMTVVGALAGIAVGLAIGRLSESMLFELRGYDPIVLGTAIASVMVLGLIAGYIPAYRASRVQPMTALKYD